MPGPRAGRAQLAGQPDRRARGLDVEGDAARARPRRSRAPSGPGPRSSGGSRAAARVALSSASTTGRPEGQVGDEVVVHDVDVHPVGASLDPARPRRPGGRSRPTGCSARSGLPTPVRIAGAGASLGRVRVAGAAQQRQEHRVGAVPVRPQLHVGPVAEVGHAGQQRRGRRRRSTLATRRRARRPRRPGSRPGAASRSRRRRRRRAGRRRSAARSSSRCSGASAGRSAGGAASAPRAAAQRAEAGARHVDQHPVEATPAATAGRVPSATTTLVRPGVAGAARARPAGPGAAASRRRAAARRAARRARRAARPCRRGRRTGRASARRGPSSGAAARASATSWLPSSWTPARPSRTAARAPGSPPSASRTAYGDQRPGARRPPARAARRRSTGRAGRPG